MNGRRKYAHLNGSTSGVARTLRVIFEGLILCILTMKLRSCVPPEIEYNSRTDARAENTARLV